MIAKMKCSNCGAEMSNLSMKWGRWQSWFMLPVMILGFFPLIKMTFFKGDITKDLVISEVQSRNVDKTLEIVGLITNNSSRQWTGVRVEAEFFDAAGAFIDEISEYIGSDIESKAKEHFKISIRYPSGQLINGSAKAVVKVAGGIARPF